MCSFRLPELFPFTEPRGLSCSTESAYDLEGKNGDKSLSDNSGYQAC
jgi:hypothetical protein